MNLTLSALSGSYLLGSYIRLVGTGKRIVEMYLVAVWQPPLK